MLELWGLSVSLLELLEGAGSMAEPADAFVSKTGRQSSTPGRVLRSLSWDVWFLVQVQLLEGWQEGNDPQKDV